MRVEFNYIFEITEEKHLIIKKKIRIQGITINPMEISGTSIGGIDWNLFNGSDLEVANFKGLVLKGIY